MDEVETIQWVYEEDGNEVYGRFIGDENGFRYETYDKAAKRNNLL